MVSLASTPNYIHKLELYMKTVGFILLPKHSCCNDIVVKKYFANSNQTQPVFIVWFWYR